MKRFLLFILLFIGSYSYAGDKPSYTIYVAAASTNITTGAYLQLDAAMDSSCSEIDVFNSTASAIYLAVGSASSEINIPYTFGPGAGTSYRARIPIAKGVRLSARALTANATTGFFIINCLQ